MRACNTGGCSAYSLEASATTLPNLPGAPSGLSATTVSAAQINLSWSAGTGTIDSYRIERKTGAAAFAEIAVVTAATLTHADLGLAAGTQYDYQVRACNASGCSGFTAPASATTLPLPPGAPSGLTAGAVSSGQINLSWSAATGTVATYHVERSTTPGSGFAEIASLGAATTTFQNTTGLSPGTQYFYRVRACNTGGCSAYTLEATATTLPLPPGAPSGLTASAVSSGQINLSWSAATGAVATYHVERSTTPASGFAEIASVSSATTTFPNNTGLSAATQYFYRVRACNTGGCSAYTLEASATTLPNPPGPPSGLSATTISSTQINLSWSAATGTVATYHVERSTTTGSGFVEIASVSSATTTFSNSTGLTAATQYFYRVRACNTGGCSAYTLEAAATTLPLPPGAPSGLTASAVSSGQINLSWTAASGTVATYHVERSTTPGSGFLEIGSVGAATTTFPNSGLNASTQYFYRVRACNTGGCSAYTLEASATTLPNLPGAPSGLIASTVSAAQINLSWSAGTGTIDSYRIERRTGAAAFGEIAVVPSATLTHADLGLAAGTQYDYQVRACNVSGCSAFTAPALGHHAAARTGCAVRAHGNSRISRADQPELERGHGHGDHLSRGTKHNVEQRLR